MTKRLNITVPDHIADMVKQFRDQINMSKVCAEALERQCRVLEATKGDKTMTQRAIARLRAQRMNLCDESEAQGYKEGNMYVLQNGNYTAIKDIDEKYELHCSEHVIGETLEDSVIFILKDIGDYDNDMNWFGEEDKNLDHTKYWEGFAHGVSDAWTKICDEVEV